jgi:hypothetical protein
MAHPVSCGCPACHLSFSKPRKLARPKNPSKVRPVKRLKAFELNSEHVRRHAFNQYKSSSDGLGEDFDQGE